MQTVVSRNVKAICDIIEQGKNGTLSFTLTDKLKTIPDEYHNYIAILCHLCEIVTTRDQIREAFSNLKPELFDYLLKFVIASFEKQEAAELRYIHVFLPVGNNPNKHSEPKCDVIYLYYYFLAFSIDVYRSDLHVLAHLYLAHLGEYLYFNSKSSNYTSCSTTMKTFIEKNVQRKKRIETCILVDSRHLSKECKKKIVREIYDNSEIITNDLLNNNLLAKFCYNNESKLGVLKIEYHTKKLVNVEPLSGVLPLETIHFSLGEFQYCKLTMPQALLCIDSKYVSDILMRRHEEADVHRLIKNRINYWINIFPEFTEYLNSSIRFGVHYNAFLSLCIFWYKLKSKEKILIKPIFDRLFVRDNLVKLLNNNIFFSRCSNQSDIFIMISILIDAFYPTKLVDGDFILNVMYIKLNILYTKSTTEIALLRESNGIVRHILSLINKMNDVPYIEIKRVINKHFSPKPKPFILALVCFDK